MDPIEFANAFKPVKRPFKFTKEDYDYIPDMTSGQFGSNQCQFDTSAWKNTNYYNYAYAYVSIPYTITATAPAGHIPNPFVQSAPVIWKNNGFLHLIHSVLLQVPGVSLTNPNPGANIKGHVDLLNAWNKTKVDSFGPSVMFSLDTSDSGTINANNPGGTRLVNNNYLPSAPANGDIPLTSAYNQGAYDRTRWLYQAPQGGGNTPYAWSYYTYNAGAGTVTITGWAMIPLAHMHDVFRQMDFPLQSARMNITLNLNTVNMTVSAIQAAAPATYPTYTINCPNWTNPLMLTQTSTAFFNAGTAGFTGGTVTLQLGAASALAQSARLYAPRIDIDPLHKQKLLEHPVRTITYEDFQIFTYVAQAGNFNINWQIVSTMQNLKKIVIMPFYSSTNMGGLLPTQTPTGSEPSTCSDSVCLQNIQLQVNGSNFYANPIIFDYEEFLHNVSLFRVGQAFDKSSYVGNSGLFNQFDFNQGPYKFYEFDITRQPDNGADRASTIQFVAQNNSGFLVDLWAICITESSAQFNNENDQTLIVKGFANQTLT